MGIPSFYRWLITKYPGTLQKLKPWNHVPRRPDHLYMDMNGILHQQTQRILKNPLLIGTTPTPDNIEPKIFESIHSYVDMIVRMVRPRKSLFLAIDGTAPVAKQTQQRKRRFVSMKEKKSDLFDSNSISPGTAWMERLHSSLDSAFRQYRKTSKNWQGFDITYSPTSVPGEGEHKIIDWCRANRNEIVQDLHCMYGNDADLIMLTLGTRMNFTILREDHYTDDFHWLNVDLVRLFFSAEIALPDMDMDRAIDDLLLCFFLIGNDFLPHQPSIEIVHSNIDDIFRIYRECYKRYGYLTETGRILPSFLQFVRLLAADEKQRLLDGKRAKRRTFPDPILDRYFVNSFDFAKWRSAYYSEKAQCSPKKLSQEYLEGLHWVFQYYLSGCKDWRWSYPNHYAPLLSDFAKVEWKDCSSVSRPPLTPYQQLLAIMPRTSKALLPGPFRKLFDHNSEIADFYPSKFDVDLGGKYAEWQGVVLLPFVDLKRLQSAHRRICKSLDPLSAEKILRRDKFTQSYKYP